MKVFKPKKRKFVKLSVMTSMSALLTACFEASHKTQQGTDGDDNLTGSANVYDIFLSSLGADKLDGVKDLLSIFGRNQIDYSHADGAVKITLDGITVGVGGHAEGDVLTNIDDAIGSDYDDELTGGAQPNKLEGGAGDDILKGLGGGDTLVGGLGADSLQGGEGTDKAEYKDSSAAVTIDLAAGTASGGDATGDVLSSIENLTGSAYADVLTGDEGDNTLFGDAGNDVIKGNGGKDWLSGEAGDDQLFGGAGDDQLYGGDGDDKLDGGTDDDNLIGDDGDDVLTGGAGDDYLSGGAGADEIKGGDGNDTISYVSAEAGVEIDLAAQSASGDYADGDVISGIENATGTRFDDVLLGSAADNVLDTYSDGFDVVNGRGGVDTVKISVGFFHQVKSDALKLNILKADDKIGFEFYGHTGELSSIEMIKYSDDAGETELDVKDMWAKLASEEQDKFSDEADFLSWLGDDAGYNYEGL